MAAGDSASQAEVARRLAIAPATLSESVQIHVENGLLTQEASPGDRRKKVLRLTPAAKKKMTEVGKYVQELEATMASGLSNEQRINLEKVLEKVVNNLESIL